MEAHRVVAMPSWNNNDSRLVNANCCSVSPNPWSPSRVNRFGTTRVPEPGPITLQNSLDSPACSSMQYATPFVHPLGVMEPQQPFDPVEAAASLESVMHRLQQTLIRMIAKEFKKGKPPTKHTYRPKRPHHSKNICTFCLQNEEDKSFYSSHVLRDVSGNVQCPVLRSYVCELCGETGDKAHTKHYCPKWKGPAAPLALLLKKGSRDCSGRVRNFNTKAF